MFNRRSHRNANLSLALIVTALVCLGLWLWGGSGIAGIAAALLGAGFVVSFVHHGRVDRQLRRYTELWAINDEGLRRLRRDWAGLPLREPPPGIDHGGAPPYALDLDLLGHASLQHLLGTPAMPVGQVALRDWILRPAAPDVVRRRQPAVAELAPLVEFRDEIALRGRLMGAAEGRSIERPYIYFLRWAESAPWLARRRWLLWLARGLPLMTLGLLAIQLIGLTAYPLWLVGAAAGFALTLAATRAVDRIINDVAARQEVFATYAELFRLIGEQPFAAPELRRLQADLTAGDLRADQQMRRLARIMPLADLRGWMFFFPIQVLTLWNVHVLWLLERWQRVAGAGARRWLLALGELEALAALATLAHDHPDWAYPEILEDRAVPLVGCDLGHPLLPPASCVGNDVTVGPPGTFLLITGSNMSGKSTLLRAIGVNVALAQAGAPVCATALRLPPITLATSMRVQDSLEQGVSYFMAELRRLKEVIDAARQTQASGERMLLFLLDEILHGTNTAERQIAVRAVVLHLLGLGATGAVSTHDLSLAELPEIAAAGRLVHFTETVTRGADGLEMRFDYHLRPGVATSTNALVLVNQLLGPEFVSPEDAISAR